MRMNYVEKHSRQFGITVMLITLCIGLGFAPNLWDGVGSELYFSFLLIWVLNLLILGAVGLALFCGAFLLSSSILKEELKQTENEE